MGDRTLTGIHLQEVSFIQEITDDVLLARIRWVDSFGQEYSSPAYLHRDMTWADGNPYLPDTARHFLFGEMLQNWLDKENKLGFDDLVSSLYSY